MTAAELADMIEQRLAALEAQKPQGKDTWAWRAWYEKVRAFIAQELVAKHGGSYDAKRGYRLQLAGIEATSSISEAQLLKNWITAARGGAS